MESVIHTHLIKISIFLVMIQMTEHLNAQSFEFIYSTSQDESIYEVIQDEKDSYYLILNQGTFPSLYNPLLIKIDSLGNFVKSQSVNSLLNNVFVGKNCLKWNDSLFVTTGIATDSITGLQGLYFLSFDSSFNYLNEKLISFSTQNLYAARIRLLSDYSLLVGGSMIDNASFDYQFYMLKLHHLDSIKNIYIYGQPNQNETLTDFLIFPDNSGYLLFT
ncbi:MAG: hypothetical protein JNL47_08220 [Bacteroidia bacterium]|nr:hypothetical protein [Bacteroidia bacterium]